MKENRIAARLADMLIRGRWFVVAAFAILTVAGMYLAQTLDTVVDPQNIMAKDNLVAQRFFDVSEQFGSTTSLIVVAEGTDRMAVIRAAHEVVDRVEVDSDLRALFRAVNLRRDVEYPLTWGMMLAETPGDIEDMQRMLEQRTLLGLLTALNDRMERVADDEERFATNQDEWRGLGMLAGLERFSELIDHGLGGQVDEQQMPTLANELVEAIFAGEQYTWSPDQQMLLFSFLPAFEDTDFEAIKLSVDGVTQILRDVENEISGVSLSVGGEIPWGYARREGVDSDMLLPTLIALLLISILFFFSFTRLRNIMLAIVVLIAGIIITTGLIAITVGHISLITSIFAVILLGLGIDFGIHLISNFDDFRLKKQDTRTALRNTLTTGGVPILLGGVTTACAFLSLAFSRSPSVSEFGLVAGMGVVVTLLTMLALLPALMVICGGKGEMKVRRWRPLIDYSFMAGLGRTIARHPYISLVAAAALTLMSTMLLSQNQVDYDPMNNSPRSHPVTHTQRRIMEKMEMSPFMSFSMQESLEQARNTSEAFRDHRFVSRTASAADFFPPADKVEERLALIAAGGSAGPGEAADISGQRWRIGSITQRSEEDLGRLVEEIQRLEWNVIEIGDLSVAGLGENNMIVRRRDAMIREIVGSNIGAAGREVFQNAMKAANANPTAGAQRLSALDAELARCLSALQRRMTVNRAPQIDDIPDDVRNQYVSADGTRFLITVLPTAEAQKSNQAIHAFHKAMTEIDPGITGAVPLYVAFVNEVFGEAAKASVYVILVVFVVLFMIFRNIGFVLSAFAMVVLGILWMFGILPLTGTQLALTAGMVFPLLIGIGTDDALHILHRFLHEKGDIASTLRYSGKAVLLTTVTTMLGFGSLAVAGEMGTIAAIGWLLLVGIGTCFLATVVVLPALLSLKQRHGEKLKARASDQAVQGTDAAEPCRVTGFITD